MARITQAPLSSEPMGGTGKRLEGRRGERFGVCSIGSFLGLDW